MLRCQRAVASPLAALGPLGGFIPCRHVNDDCLVPRVKSHRPSVQHRERDHGYFHNYYQTGQRLPRLKANFSRVPLPEKKKSDEWEGKNALLGQNDYIDLLGDGSVHPAQLLYHVPRWLRGFPGDHRANELIRKIHYRNTHEDLIKRNMPKTWHELCKHINYLLKYHNYRKSDEIRLERELGIWKSEPDYAYKERWHHRWHKDFLDNYY